MVTYTAHERDGASGSVAERADAIVFVKEGFAWLALFVPVLWLLVHRMWLVLLCFVAALLAVQGIVSAAGLKETLAGWGATALSLLLALQGNDLRRWTLARRGYRTVGLASGRNQEECERRFFEGWLAAQDKRADDPPASSRALARPAEQNSNRKSAPDSKAGDDEVIGLFPEPGR